MPLVVLVFAPILYAHCICCGKFWQFISILASKAQNNLNVLKKSQSILVTGVTGSGKTETVKHVIEFLSQATISQNGYNSSPVLEAFGNAKTRGNENSSRFCKHIEVIRLLIFVTKIILHACILGVIKFIHSYISKVIR